MFKQQPIAASFALAFGAGAALLVSVPAFAQQDASAQKLERVEVTGSAIRRIEGESALPVQVITKEEIVRTGATTAAELLDKIAANNGQGYNFSLALGDAARPGFSGISLRGLGSNLTLVLLNGRRLAVYAFDGGGVDVNAISLNAIERVEVLKDGASALYGTDAVGGVVNFITRKDYKGIEVSAGTQQPEASGGKYYNASVAVGFGDLGKDRFNVFGNLSYDKQDAIKASQRQFAKTAYRPFAPGAPGGPDPVAFNRLSSNAFPANILLPNGFFNPFAPKFSGYTGPTITTDPVKNIYPPGCYVPASYGTTSNDTRCRYDYASTIDILPPSEKYGIFVKGILQLNADNQLYAEAGYQHNKTKFVVSGDPVSEATTFNGDPVLYPAGGKYYPGNGIIPAIPGVTLSGDLDLYWRTLDLGGRTNETTTKQSRYVLGLTGTLAGWDYDTAVAQAESKATDNYTSGWVSESRLLRTGGLTPKEPGYSAAVQPIDPNINPFGFQDAAGLAALKQAEVNQKVREGKSTRTTWDGKISREIGQWAAGPVALAVGAEASRIKYDDVIEPIFSSGDLVGSGGDLQTTKGSRNQKSLFGELVVPVMRSLTATFQARYDHYSDFGSTTNPKVALRWQPTPQLLVRASANRGFRAPTMPELFGPQVQTNSGGNYNDPFYDRLTLDASGNPINCDVNFNPKYCNYQAKVLQGGNPNLKPEKSNQVSVGFVLEPTRDLSLSVDYFNIGIKDQIGIILGDTKLQDYIDNFNYATGTSTSRYTNDIVRGADGFINFVNSVYENIGVQRIAGYDVSARAMLARTSVGDFGFNIDATYIAKDVQKTTGDYEPILGTFSIFGPVVQLKYRSELNWNWTGWRTSLAYNWQSSYKEPVTATTERDVGQYETWDLLVTYSGIKNLTVRGGVRNLLDRDPPYSRQNQYFQVGYDPTYADVRGRTYTLSATYRFY
jgi:iron complex outermembrane receptor protein